MISSIVERLGILIGSGRLLGNLFVLGFAGLMGILHAGLVLGLIAQLLI